MKEDQVQEINEAQFNAHVLQSRQPVLVAFLASWSPACVRFEPKLEEVAKVCGERARVFKLDVDDNPDLGTEYGIQSIPTLIFFCDGAVRAKIIGTASAKAILAKLQLPQTDSAGESNSGQALPDPEI